MADVLEFHRERESGPSQHDPGGLPLALALDGVKGLWKPFPVEYKAGRLRREEGYEVQLCAQALCLEEMLGVAVPAGALFYGKTARRLEIAFDDVLRAETAAAATRLHELVRGGKTPKARYEKKCDKCSLISLCMPKTTGAQKNVRSYIRRAVTQTDWETK